MILWGYWRSTAAWRVRIALALKGLPAEHRFRHLRRGEQRSAEALAINPQGLVPALVLEDGRLIWVEAAPERLLEIRAASDHALKRLIWHIGNRHIPAEIGAEAVWIADDHVLADMVRGLGGTAEPVERPFRPEGGAYSGGHGHDHPHGGHHHHHADG